MVIFNSYVSLPEGSSIFGACQFVGLDILGKRHITVPWAAQETPIPQVSAMLGTQLSQSILSWLVVSKMFIFSHSTGTMIPDNELPFFSGGLKAPSSTLYYLQWDRFMQHLKILGALPPLEGCSGVNLHMLNYIDICPLFWMRGVDPANVDPVQISHRALKYSIKHIPTARLRLAHPVRIQ